MSEDHALTDLAWRGHSAGAMLPSFAICTAISSALLFAEWFVDEAEGTWQRIGSPVLFALVWGIWIFQLFRWVYRGATYVYRLTPTMLFIDRGFLYPAEPPVELIRVEIVSWGTNLLTRWIGIGWVAIATEDGSVRRLPGVSRPAAFAEQIEAAAKKQKMTIPVDASSKL